MRSALFLLLPLLAGTLSAQATQQAQRFRVALVGGPANEGRSIEGAARAALAQVPQAELVKGTAADLVVRATVTGSGDQMTVEATASNRDGTTLHRLPAERGSGALDRLAERIAGMTAFHIERRALQTPHLYSMPTLRALRLQQRAESLFYVGRPNDALPVIAQALEADSSYSPVLFLAAAIHGNAGRAAAQDSVLRFIAARADRLTEIERLNLAWFRDPPAQAFATARAASRLDPRSDIWTYAVGFRANSAGYFEDAVRALSRRAEFAARGSQSAQVWPAWRSQYLEALHATEDYGRELSEVRLARTELPNANENLYVAQEMRALAALGRVGELRAIVQRLMKRRADSVPVLQIQIAGLELKRHGRAQDGETLIAEAGAFAAANEGALDSLVAATALGLARRYDEALPRLERLANGSTVPVRVGRYGAFATLAGRRDVADQAMARLIALGETPQSYVWRGLMLAAAGRCEDAVSAFRTATEKGQAFGGGTFWHMDPATEPIWGCEAWKKLVPMRAP